MGKNLGDDRTAWFARPGQAGLPEHALLAGVAWEVGIRGPAEACGAKVGFSCSQTGLFNSVQYQ
jgi:hypothetical protein